MREKIIIEENWIEEVANGLKVRFYTRYIIQKNAEKKQYVVWYELDKIYQNYLTLERADAALVTIIPYAMEQQFDIYCKEKVSEELYYQLVTYLIPSMSKNIKEFHNISIICDTTSERLSSENGVGVVLSGGVDSFYTITRHLKRKEINHNITHVCFFNVGSCGNEEERARKLYEKRKNWIKDASRQLDLPFICVDSNVSEFLLQDHEKTVSFRTLAVPLLLQKLFSKYYFSSSYPFKFFEFEYKHLTKFDLLTVQCLSTENIKFYSSGGECTRLEKVKYISNFDITYNNLNVCGPMATNCSKCEKCARTMLELYLVGKLDLYSKVFDTEMFYRNKHKYYQLMIAYNNMPDNMEIYQMLKKRHCINVGDYIFGYILSIYFKIRKKFSHNRQLRIMYHRFKDRNEV